MRLLHEQLDLMRRQGHLKPVPVRAMTHALSGAMNELALWIAQHPGSADAALDEAMEVIARLLDGFRSDA
jgi:hypothetical protein